MYGRWEAMKIPISTALIDVYTDLIGYQASIDYETLKPSDVTRYILNIFNHNDEDLTVDVIHNVIQTLHDNFTTFDYDKISEILGLNIRNEVIEIKELFKMKNENTSNIEV